MITKMEKLTFLVFHKEYEAFLEGIRNLGVVHVVEKQCGGMDAELQNFVQKRSQYKTLLAEMSQLAGKQPEEAVHPEMGEEALWTRYADQQKQLQELNLRIPALDKEIAQMDVWGEFSWERIESLKASGWNLRFYATPEKDFKEEWNQREDLMVIDKVNGTVYFVTLSNAPIDLGLESLRLPRKSLSQLTADKQQLLAEISDKQTQLQAFCRTYYRTACHYARQLASNIDLKTVRLSGEQMADGAVVLLEGWIPEENAAAVTQWLDEKGIYYTMRAATKEDNAPIKFKNNAFTRMYEVLTKMYGMPDYSEFDPTPIVAPFFTLFFAMCMGDAGYGVILVLLGFFLKKKMPKSMAGMMNLVITLGIVTTVVGTVLGSCFGVSLFDLQLPDALKQFMIVGKIDGTGYDKQMLLALLIGVVHICIAMTVKAITNTVRYGFKNTLSDWGWLLLVVGFIATGGLSFFEVISRNVSTWAFILIGSVASIGIYLLNNIHRNVFVNIGAGLWDTYNMATGLMGDVLSYIRLYALGLAGGMLGGVFNQLAFMVQDAAGGVPGWIFCGLILVFGHTLNIAMSCLSAFVHPLRLTFVEYFKNSGYDGKGEPYKPFSVIKTND